MVVLAGMAVEALITIMSAMPLVALLAIKTVMFFFADEMTVMD